MPGGERADESLMRAYAGGEAGAFEVLYRRHKDALFRYFLRHTGSSDVTAELFEDAWKKLVEARHRYRPQAPFTTYLFRIAHERLLDHWRTRYPAVQVPFDLPAGEGQTPEALMTRNVLAEQLRRALMKLPLEQREIIVLCEERELTLEQIADIQGVGRETVRSRLRYALAKLREAVGRG